MNLKHKTFIALSVKLLFCFSVAQAQQKAASAKQNAVQFSRCFINPSIQYKTVPAQLPANFYAKQLPFFCSKELQVQKAIGFPIKFRLGSVVYCDKLEGKNR